MKQDDSSPWPQAGAALALLLSLYVGLYAWLCTPTPSLRFHWPSVTLYLRSPTRPPTIPFHYICVPKYKMGGRVSEIIFRPVQKLDEQLFPTRWKKR